MEEKIKKPRKKRKSKYSIEDMQAFAKAKGGKCLSKKYKGYKDKLKWQCKEGHIWLTSPYLIVNQRSWCPLCYYISRTSDPKKTLEEMKRIAIDRGGKCLSDTYPGSSSNLQWQCAEGHVWSAMPYSVKGGSWCHQCSIKVRGNNLKGNLEEYKKIAIKRKGKCLSTQYINSYSKLEWQCSKGHIWKAQPNLVKSGTWCPYCAGNIMLSLEAAQSLAQKHNGKCLSKQYIPGKMLTWECAKGHVWSRRYNEIIRIGWCSICRKEERKAAKKLPPIL